MPQKPNLDKTFSEDNIRQVDRAISRGEVDAAELPAHVQSELSQRGSMHFADPELEQAGLQGNNQEDDGSDPFAESEQALAGLEESRKSNEHDRHILAGMLLNNNDAARTATYAESVLSPRKELENTVAQEINSSYEAFRNRVRSLGGAGEGPVNQEQFIKEAERTAQGLQFLEGLSEDDKKFAKAYAFYSAGNFASLKDIEDETADQIMAFELYDMVEGRDWWDSARDFAAGFVPGDIIEDQLDILGFDVGQLPLVSDTKAAWASMVTKFRGMEPEERLERWPAIKQYLQEHLTGGEAIAMLQDLAGIDGSVPAENMQMSQSIAALDAIDASTLTKWASGAIKAGASSRLASNIISSSRRLKNIHKTQKAIVESLNDEAVAKAYGSSRVDAANESVPASYSGGTRLTIREGVSDARRKELLDKYGPALKKTYKDEEDALANGLASARDGKVPASDSKDIVTENIRQKPTFTQANKVSDELPVELQKEIGAFQQQLDRTIDDLANGSSIVKESPFVTPEEAVRAQSSINKQIKEIYENYGNAATHIELEDIGGGEIRARVFLTRKKRLDPYTVKNDPQSQEILTAVQTQLDDFLGAGTLSDRAYDEIIKTALANKAGIKDLRDVVSWVRQKNKAGIRVDARSAEFKKQLNKLKIRGADTREYVITPRLDETTGAYTQDRLPISQWTRSNLSVAKTPDTRAAAQGAIRLDNLSAKVAQELETQFKSIFDELPKEAQPGIIPYGRKKAKMHVQRALVEGDEYVDPQTGQEVGRVWTEYELRNKFGLSKPEIRAYYKTRSLYDRLAILKDIAAGQEFRARGFKHLQITVTPEEGKKFRLNDLARPMEGSANRILNDLRNQPKGRAVREIYDAVNGRVLSVSDLAEHLEDFLKKGLRVVQLHEPLKAGKKSGYRFGYALVPDNAMKSVPFRGVMRFRAGHIPRVYDRGVYFIKHVGPQRVNGQIVEEFPYKTVGLADNEKAAQALVDAENRRLAAEGIEGVRAVRLNDQELDPTELMTSGASGGKLFTRRRGDAPVPQYKLDEMTGELIEEKASRVDALKQIESDIHNIGMQYPRNTWRIAMIQRLENTAKKLNVEWRGLNEAATGGNPKAVSFIERQREQLRDWLYLSTSGEKRWQNYMQQVYESALGRPLFDKAAEGVWWLKSQNPATFAKGAAFHLLLGWFNPVQLFVQAQGFSVAFGTQMFRMKGIDNIMNVWRKQKVLGAARLAASDDVIRGYAKQIDGIDPEELVALTDAYKRSGLHDGLLTTGDYSAAQMGFGYDISAVKDFANRKGLMFYRAGEEFNRRFSFSAALEDFWRANPKRSKSKKLSDSELSQVLAKANNYMLNMGRGNRAPWQKGLLGVPTQFWQVQAKLIEQMLGKEFTRAEKVKIMLGQIGLYGAAGVPIVGTMIEEEANEAIKDLESPLRRTITEGGWGLAFAALGIDTDVANRGAIFADLERTVYDLFFGDKTLGDTAMGAFGALGPRMQRASTQMDLLRKALWSEEIDADPALILTSLSSFTDIFSSLSNPTKAYIMLNNDAVYSTSGEKIAEKDVNLQTALAVAFGMRPLEEGATYDLSRLNRMMSSHKSEMKKAARQFMLRYISLNGSGDMTEEQSLNLLRAMSFVLRPLSRSDRNDMINEMLEEVRTGKTKFAKEMNEYLGHITSMATDDILGYLERASGGGAVVDEDQLDPTERDLIDTRVGQ